MLAVPEPILAEGPAAPRDAPFHEWRLENGRLYAAFFRRGDGFEIDFPDVATARISADGSVLDLAPAVETGAATLDHLRDNIVMPLAFGLRGQLAFHAAVVSSPLGAVALVGHSGAGKSTLAATLVRNGGALLSDDVLLLDWQSERCHACAAGGALRLTSESRAALGLDARSHGPTLNGKVSVGKRPVADLNAPLRAALFLIPDTEAVSLTPIQGAGLHYAWTENSFLLAVDDPEALRDHARRVARLAVAVPAYRLSMPRHYDALHEVLDCLDAAGLWAGS